MVHSKSIRHPLFVIYSLGAGGAERVLSLIANRWAENGWPVTIATLTGSADKPFYPLHTSVRLRRLDVARQSSGKVVAVARNLQRIAALRQVVREETPDVIITFMVTSNVLTLFATLGLQVPVVVSERCDPRHVRVGTWLALGRRATYGRAAAVVVQTETAGRSLPASARHRIRVFPNPVPAPPEFDRKRPATHRRRLLAMGRLTEQKGFDLLLEAFAPLVHRFPDWRLDVFGEGEDRRSLERLRDALGLHDYANFPGVTETPYAEMAASDLFVLSSRFEGFPNVLCEAMASGLPVVSFDCPSGPADVVTDGVDGVLVPQADILALRRALERLMADTEERNRLAARARQILDRFGTESVLGLWDELVDNVCHEH